MTTLVFSLGPVQGFIAQSRRTADGWVGSYLLSYLAGHALAYLESQLGQVNIIEPDPHVPMYEAITQLLRTRGTVPNKSISGDTTIAALPNVLVLNVRDGKTPNDLGQQAENEILGAWENIYKAVWGTLPMQSNSQAEEIWNNQVGLHWECYWAWGEHSQAAFRNLAARKGLRDFGPSEETGDRCTVCAQREALWDKKEPRGANDRQARDVAKRLWRAWGGTINQLPGTPQTLIQPDGKERLCAICLIKRLIPWVENPIKDIWKAGMKSPDPPSVFPSTSTMATVLYKAKLIKQACCSPKLQQAMNDYRKVLDDHKKAKPADPLSAFLCWESTKTIAVEAGWADADVDRLLRMDGDWYLYGDAVKNQECIPDHLHKQFNDAYRDLRRAARNPDAEEAPIYYALLTMDGDKMGDFKEKVAEAWPHDQGKTREVSSVLNEFAQNDVQEVIRQYNGRTVYAGGDDVLAFLPLENALKAADALRKKFFCRFGEWKAKKQLANPYNEEVKALQVPTLSGSIIYAHHQAPLGRVIWEGHTILTDWAKKRAGRNALAVERYQRGGPSVTFAARWDLDGQPLAQRLDSVQAKLKGPDRQLASRFLYGLQDVVWMFEDGGPFADRAHPEDGAAYLKALLLKSRLGERRTAQEKERQAEALALELLALCRGCEGEKKEGLAVAPLLMVRFLSGGGREER